MSAEMPLNNLWELLRNDIHVVLVLLQRITGFGEDKTLPDFTDNEFHKYLNNFQIKLLKKVQMYESKFSYAENKALMLHEQIYKAKISHGLSSLRLINNELDHVLSFSLKKNNQTEDIIKFTDWQKLFSNVTEIDKYKSELQSLVNYYPEDFIKDKKYSN